jgi:hypothetical protein
MKKVVCSKEFIYIITPNSNLLIYNPERKIDRGKIIFFTIQNMISN